MTVYEESQIAKFRRFLLSLASDDKRMEAMNALDFCLSCGEDMEGRDGPRYCRADL